MSIRIEKYTKENIQDVLEFERKLRRQEPDTYFWDIDENYIRNVEKSFENKNMKNSAISLLAYRDDSVIGRIDASLINTHFDGTVYNAYLDWICVIKEERHQGIAQMLMNELKSTLKEKKIETLIALTAANEDASKFYDAIEEKEIYQGIMIKI